MLSVMKHENLAIHGRWRHLTISLTPIRKLYRNNKRNLCGGTASGFVGGPVFSVFFLFTRFLTRIR